MGSQLHVRLKLAYKVLLFRSMKVEETRHKREIEYHLKVLEMENQRRGQEREHKLKLVKLLLKQQPSSNQQYQSMLPLSMTTSSP